MFVNLYVRTLSDTPILITESTSCPSCICCSVVYYDYCNGATQGTFPNFGYPQISFWCDLNYSFSLGKKGQFLAIRSLVRDFAYKKAKGKA